MEFLGENRGVKEKAESLKKKFQDQIEKLQKSDTEGYRRKIDEAPDLQTKNRYLRDLLETNLPLSAILLDKLIANDRKNSLLYLEWMSHRVNVAMSSESFTKAKLIAEEAHRVAKDVFTSSQHNYMDAQIPRRSAYKAYLKACTDLLTICRFQGKVTDAETYLEEAKAVAVKEGDVDDQHRLRILEGDLLLARGHLNNAIENFFEPLLHTQNLIDCNRGLLLQKFGNACRSAARWGLAKDYLRESIRIAQELEDKIAEFDRLTDLGNVYRSEGRIADALEQQVSHMIFAFSRGDLWGLTVSSFNMGFAYYSITPHPDLKRALILLALKYDLAIRTDNEPLRGMALNNLGKVFCALGQYEMALKVMTESVEVARKTLNIAGEGMAYGNIGTAYRSLGKHEEAICNHNKYLENASDRGDDGGAAIMQRELAIDYLCKGDLENAEKQVRDAISTLETIRNKLGSEDSSKIANFDKNQAETYSLLQVILVRQGKYSEALALSELARSRALTDLIRDRHVKISAIKNSSWIYTSDFVNRWQDLIEQILSDYKSTADSLKTNFVVYSVLKDYDANGIGQQWLYIWVVLNEEASKGGERIRFRREILNQVIHGEFLADSGFFASLTRSFRVSSNDAPDQLKTKNEKKDDMEVKPEDKIIVKLPDTPEVKELLELLKSLSLTEASQSREQHEPLNNEDEKVQCRNVETSLKDVSFYEKEQNPENEDKDRAEPILDRYMDRGSWNRDGKKQLPLLYRLCIAPIDDCLPCGTEEYAPRITIIPHEFLFNVPFCCLNDERQGYLIERFILNYAPSLRALCLLNHRFKHLEKRQGQRKLKVLAIGDPTMCLPDVPNLPCSGGEARNVQAVFGPEQCQLALRNNATKKLLLKELKNIDVLHLATHACPQDTEAGSETAKGDYTMRGCLLLASSGEKCEGVVEASDIAAENCTCQLVTLSCCETGLGKLTSDGVVGLYRAFLVAGAASVLVTLWKIRDDVTLIFMEHFYAEFKATKKVSESLRSAMLFCIREKELPPQQWAAFSLVGADF